LRDALTIVLRLLRASGRSEHYVATNGAFQLMLGGSSSQMVRISLKMHDPYIPEISANKYALNIRFTRPDSDHRPPRCHSTCCSDSDVDQFDMSSRQIRQRNSQNSQQRSRIASTAARLMAEDGITDLALAKRKAARSLGLPESVAMPDDSEVEAELRTYQRLFQHEEQEARNLHLLRTAARLMATMERFNPYLSGAVLEGMAGRFTEIDIQLFTDSAKDVEIFLLNERIAFRHSVPRSDRAEAGADGGCR
jgi:hypothetical protein